KVDPFKLSGTIFQVNNPGFGAPANVRINDFDSILGRASLRVGRNFLVGNWGLQPFVTASVLHEFAGRVRTNINTTFDAFGTAAGSPGLLAPLDSVGAISSGRIGTYGQFAAGIAGRILETGWLGYVRGDYRVGDRVEGWGVSGGLRYQFTPDVVAARNIVRKGYDPVPEILPQLAGPVSWTGISLGGSLGATWGYSHLDITGAGRVSPDYAGLLVGGQVGADYQFGQVVVGIAGDAAWSNARGGRGCPNVGALFFYNCETTTDFLGMATARVGYAWGRSLLYVKGGAAFADLRERAKDNAGNQPLLGGITLADTTSRPYSAMGWAIGAGAEFAVTTNWSVKAEYMHYELERRQLAFQTPGVAPTSAAHDGDLVRVGVNYRFNLDLGGSPTLVR
ncbi:MAG: outer rane autotransporter barrel, partial [Enterovirga sp.]|nr:outer rane autotransporter barrel [Enterovirga sp.]